MSSPESGSSGGGGKEKPANVVVVKGEVGSSKKIKWAFCITNAIIFLCGTAAMGVGLWFVLDAAAMRRSLGSDIYTFACYLMLAAGSLIMFMTILGCASAFIRAPMLILVYVILLILVFFLLLGCGILGFFIRNMVRPKLQRK